MRTNFTTPRCGLFAKAPSTVSYAKRIRRTAVVVVFLLTCPAFLVGCKGVDLGTLRQENAALVMSMYRAKPLEAVNNGSVEISLHDCVRIALSAGLDLQAVIWDEQVKTRLAKASLIRTMPRIWGLYNISQRNGVQFSRSDVIGQEGAYEVYGPGPGTGVTNFSTGRESFTRTSHIQIDWSPMDACMAKYISDMRYNEALQSKYQRVRVAQQMVGTVTAAFYRLLALELAHGKARALEGKRSAIVRDLKKLSEKQLIDTQDLLTAQALMVEARNLVAEIGLNIEKQRELLAVTMNVSPCRMCVKGYFPEFKCPNPCELEQLALLNRPEAYQADLGLSSASADYKRLLVKYFPRVEGWLGYFRDENKFMLNKSWNDGGMKVTVDLLDFTANLYESEAAKDRIGKSDRERAVICLGIVSQVKLKCLEAMRAIERYKKNMELKPMAAEAYRIAKVQEKAKDRQAPSHLTLLSTEKALAQIYQVEVDIMLSLGDVHAALAEVDAATGMNYPVAAAGLKYGPVTPPGPPRPLEFWKSAALFLSRPFAGK